jgi:hypothetical protein
LEPSVSGLQQRAQVQKAAVPLGLAAALAALRASEPEREQLGPQQEQRPGRLQELVWVPRLVPLAALQEQEQGAQQERLRCPLL